MAAASDRHGAINKNGQREHQPEQNVNLQLQSTPAGLEKGRAIGVVSAAAKRQNKCDAVGKTHLFWRELEL